MSLFPAVFALLAADPAVSAIVGDRIFREIAHAPAPGAAYVVWWPVAGSPENNLSDRPPIDRYTFRFDCYATDESELDSLAVAVRNSVEAVGHVESMQSLGKEPETGLWRFVIDLDWYHHRN